ncbi:MAG: class I SAM-dependent methyltransferase [Acidobacteriota bacterium]
MSDLPYAEMLAREGRHWDAVTLDLLKRGIVPYCCDFRLHMTQLLLERDGRPFHLGAGVLPTRFREVRNVLGGAAERIASGARDVLDVGCGGGWLALELARQGGRVTAIDVSEDNLALARFFSRRNAESAPFLYPTFVGLPLATFGEASFVKGDLNGTLADLAPGRFDVATVWDSLHHVRDLATLFPQIAGTLRPGGFFIGHDFVGPGTDTHTLNGVLQESIREVFRKLSAPELRSLRRHLAGAGATVPLGENAIDASTHPAPGAREYVERTVAEAAAMLHLSERTQPPPESPFEEVSVGYLLTELERSFDIRGFYSMGAYMPEDMPPPPDDPDDLGGTFFHYLSCFFLAFDDLLIDAGCGVGRYVCFVAVPRGSDAATPAFRRTAGPLLARLSGSDGGAVPAELARLRDRNSFLETENRILRRLLSTPPGPSADAQRFYFKVLRPLLVRLKSGLGAG